MYNITLQEYDNFLLSKGRAPLTRSGYSADVTQFLAFANMQPELVTRREVFEFDVTLAHKGLDTKTRARKHAALKSFFEFISRKYQVANVADGLEKLRRTESDPKILHPEELQSILHSLDEKDPLQARDGALIAFMSGTGVRREEAQLLDCGSIRPRQIKDKLTIRRVWQAEVQSIKPRNRMRYVNFGNLSDENDVVSRHFGAWLLMRINDLGGYTAARNIPLFPAIGRIAKANIANVRCTSRLSVSSINHTIRAAIERLGNPLLDWVTPHTLRHFYATQCIAEGMDIRDLSHYMGHKSVTSTEHYIHLAEKLLAAKAVKFNPLAQVDAKPSLSRVPMSAIAQAAFMILPAEQA